jgi:hypothetical protein
VVALPYKRLPSSLRVLELCNITLKTESLKPKRAFTLKTLEQTLEWTVAPPVPLSNLLLGELTISPHCTFLLTLRLPPSAQRGMPPLQLSVFNLHTLGQLYTVEADYLEWLEESCSALEQTLREDAAQRMEAYKVRGRGMGHQGQGGRMACHGCILACC